MAEKLVVIGNGMAPGRALDRLFETAPGKYDVTIFNAEPRVNYDRIMLSPVLSGEKAFEQIVIHGDGWYVKHGVTLYKGCKVTKIDRATKTVTSETGITAPYDKLIIATGSLPIIIPVPGSNLAGVLAYRDLDDVHAMLLAAKVSRQCRRYRRRTSRPRSCGGSQRAGHGRYRPPPHADADGETARRDCGPPVAARGRNARNQSHHAREHGSHPRQNEGRRCAS